MTSISKEIPEKNPAQLKRFWLETAGYLTAFAALAFLVPYVRLHEVREWPAYPLGAAVLVAIGALVLPASVLNPLYRSYLVPFVLIGMVMSRVVLGILFFVVVFPLGAMMRLTGKDPMRRTLDKTAASYRNPSQIRTKESVEAPF